MDIDYEHFIEEIRIRPCIWNLQEDTYRNRQLREKSWEEITTLFAKRELVNTERHKLCEQLKKIWKNMRLNFSRELKKIKSLPSGSGAVDQRSTYTYYRNLNFLEKVLTPRDHSCNYDSEGANSPSELHLPEPDLSTPRSSRKKSKMSPADREFLNLFSENQKIRAEVLRRAENEGPDHRFGRCVSDELINVPEIPKAKLKADIMALIYRYKAEYGVIEKTPTNNLINSSTTSSSHQPIATNQVSPQPPFVHPNYQSSTHRVSSPFRPPTPLLFPSQLQEPQTTRTGPGLQMDPFLRNYPYGTYFGNESQK